MVEQPCHGDALLQADGEEVGPVGGDVVEAGGEAGGEGRDAEGGEMGEERGVGDGTGGHGGLGIGVDELVAEGAVREVGALGEEEDGVRGGLVDCAAAVVEVGD